MIKKFVWNEETKDWERVDRVQEYKGVQIKTVTYHWGYIEPLRIRNHRKYVLTYPNGRVAEWGINKRGGNIKELKEYIDFQIKYGRI